MEGGKEKEKKQVLLRLSPSLWEELVTWSEDEFRSLNGQIEYLLTDCVKRRKKSKSGSEREKD
jgi:hypothetical protein